MANQRHRQPANKLGLHCLPLQCRPGASASGQHDILYRNLEHPLIAPPAAAPDVYQAAAALQQSWPAHAHHLTKMVSSLEHSHVTWQISNISQSHLQQLLKRADDVPTQWSSWYPEPCLCCEELLLPCRQVIA